MSGPATIMLRLGRQYSLRRAAQKPDGSPMFLPPNSALRAGAVKMVGDPVCWVVAETSKQAQDAAELIIVDYDEQKAITSTAHALDTDAGTVWDEAPDNVCFVFELGDKDKTEAALQTRTTLLG